MSAKTKLPKKRNIKAQKAESLVRQSVPEQPLDSARKRAMEGLRRGVGSGLAMVLVVLLCFVLVMVPEVSATRFIVGGGNKGWTSNVNYTIWAQDKHFYNGDWLCKLLFSQIHFAY